MGKTAIGPAQAYTEALQRAFKQTTLREMERATGIYPVRRGAAIGDPAPEGRGLAVVLRDAPPNCPNCGAPHEALRCSYCLTPSR